MTKLCGSNSTITYVAKQVFAIYVLMLVVACTPSPTLKIAHHPEQAWQQHRTALSKLDHWRFSGVVSIQQGHRVQSANIEWLQNHQNFSMELYGPLGLDAVTIEGYPGHVQLHHNQKLYRANSAVALMDKILGWSVPISGARYWVRGLPIPNVINRLQLNQYGLLASLAQQGWQMQFLQYMVVRQYGLPCLIKLKRGQLQITLAVDYWQVFFKK